MEFFSNVFTQFKCIGSNCKASCCEDGWNIYIDVATIDKCQNSKKEISKEILSCLEAQDNGGYKIALSENGECPFFDENKLCRVYLELGEEWMPNTCRKFPRNIKVFGENTIKNVSVGCEEVLNIIYNMEEDVKVQIEQTEIEGESTFINLLAVLDFCMTTLQDKSLDFDLSLSTILYIMNDLKSVNDIDSLATANDVYNTFYQAKMDFSKEEIEEYALRNIYNIVNTFCQIIKASDCEGRGDCLWDEHFFEWNDEKGYEVFCERIKKRRFDEKIKAYMQRLSASFFQYKCMDFAKWDDSKIFIQNMCNYFVLVDVMPYLWEEEYAIGSKEYFSRLARFGRLFDQSNAIHKYVHPVIEDLYGLDITSYASIFMWLYG